jgi:hypothetical protein
MRCPCDHDEDDLCLNGLIYVNCGYESCGGACVDDGRCQSLPGCCDPERGIGPPERALHREPPPLERRPFRGLSVGAGSPQDIGYDSGYE